MRCILLLSLCFILVSCSNSPYAGHKVSAEVGSAEELRAALAGEPSPSVEQILRNAKHPANRQQYLEAGVHRDVNRYRAVKRKPQLRRDPALNALAREHSALMSVKIQKSGQKIYLAHDKWKSRVKSMRKMDYGKVAENLAGAWAVHETHNQEVIDQFVNGWVRSKSHLKNLADSDYRHTGVGIALGPNGTLFVTQLYAQ